MIQFALKLLLLSILTVDDISAGNTTSIITPLLSKVLFYGLVNSNSPVDCTFDNNQCSWLDISTTIRWQRRNLDSLSSADHTTNRRVGSYMSVDASTIAGTKNVASMKSVRIQAGDGYLCLVFYYRMTFNVGTLEVIASQNSANQKVLWSSADDSDAILQADEDWVRVQVPLDTNSYASYRIILKGTLHRRTIGGIGLDDISLSQDTCDKASAVHHLNTIIITRQTTTFPGTFGSHLLRTCDFETSLCEWRSTLADTTWQVTSGKSSPGSLYGVTFDHTKQTANGQYLVVNGLSKGVARLDTTVSASSSFKCFQFYYEMYGRNVGRLQIKVIPSGGSFQDEMVLFEAAGNKPAKWLHGRASIDGLAGDYTLRIEAFATGQQDGDIAIDDVGFSQSNCYTSLAQQYAALSATTYSTPPNPYFCDFEDGSLCDRTVQFNSDDNRQWQWQLLTPADATAAGGPSIDKSTQSSGGHFAGFLGGRFGSKGSIYTKKYSSNEINCMTFWYYMGRNDDSAETLLVLYQVVNGKPDTQLFAVRGTSDNRAQWMNPQVVIPGNTGDFSIKFTAVSSGPRSVVIIDDVALSRNDKCSPLTRSLSIPLPGNRRRRQASDYTDTDTDNVPNSREFRSNPPRVLSAQSLLKCRFGQGDFCDWAATNQWKVSSTSADQDISGPDDRFAYVASGRLSFFKDPALQSADMVCNVTGTLTSRLVDVIGSEAQQSCLHFWYKIAGWFRDFPMDTLNIYIRRGSKNWSPKRLVASFSSSMVPSEPVNQWDKRKLTLFEQSDFQVIFEAVTGDSWMGSIAIDDIELRTTTCLPADGHTTTLN